MVGTLVTFRSALEEFKAGVNGEVIICDNSDNKAFMRSLRGKFRESEWLTDGVVKYTDQPYPCIFTAREKAIDLAEGKYIMIVDSHCLFGKDSLITMLDCAERNENGGFTYGLMNFSRDHEHDSFCDRDISDFLGIRQYKYDYKSEEYEIPFRGMPFLCRREFFDEIGRYGALSRYRLSWGGGDFYLGMKSLMFGYTNIMTTKASVIHLGPFKNSKYFPVSFIRESGREYPKRFGMLLTAYIVGGKPLLRARIEQLSTRLEYVELSKIEYDKILEIGDYERELISPKIKMSYDDILEKFIPLQHQSDTQSIGYTKLPPMSGTLEEKGVIVNESKRFRIRMGFRKNSWQARIIEGQDRKKISRSNG